MEKSGPEDWVADQLKYDRYTEIKENGYKASQ